MIMRLTNSKGIHDITNLNPSVSNSGDYLQAARTLSLGIVSTNNDPDVPSIDIQLGNVIQLYQSGEEIFYGYVFECSKGTDAKVIDLNCYDCGIFEKNKLFI